MKDIEAIGIIKAAATRLEEKRVKTKPTGPLMYEQSNHVFLRAGEGSEKYYYSVGFRKSVNGIDYTNTVEISGYAATRRGLPGEFISMLSIPFSTVLGPNEDPQNVRVMNSAKRGNIKIDSLSHEVQIFPFGSEVPKIIQEGTEVHKLSLAGIILASRRFFANKHH